MSLQYTQTSHLRCATSLGLRGVSREKNFAFSEMGQECGQDWGSDQLSNIEDKIRTLKSEQDELRGGPAQRRIQVKVDRYQEVRKRWEEQVRDCTGGTTSSTGAGSTDTRG